jgi:ribosomal protein S27AE
MFACGAIIQAMEVEIPENKLNCPQCGGELLADHGQVFLTCPYCKSTVYLDKSQVVFHWYLTPTLQENQARGALARWMAGNQTVKDLDKKSQVVSSSFSYFPLWYFKKRDTKGQERIYLEAAAAISVSELRNLRLPAGDLKRYDDTIAAQAQTPSVPLATALGWLREHHGIGRAEVQEQALVHVPIFTFKYIYEGVPFTAIVEGATGIVFANIYPAKAEAPYLLAGGATALVFLCLSSFPVVGLISAGIGGAGIGMLICSGLGILAAPLLFALAVWVAAKV